MTTRKSKSAKTKSASKPVRPSSLHHRLDALLQTMRCIAQYEDALCEVSHEVKRSGLLTPTTKDELRLILDKIPSHDFLHDLDSVSQIVQSTALKESGVL